MINLIMIFILAVSAAIFGDIFILADYDETRIRNSTVLKLLYRTKYGSFILSGLFLLTFLIIFSLVEKGDLYVLL